MFLVGHIQYRPTIKSSRAEVKGFSFVGPELSFPESSWSPWRIPARWMENK